MRYTESGTCIECLKQSSKKVRSRPGYYERVEQPNKRKHYCANPAPYLWRRAKFRAARDGVEFSIAVSDIKVPESCPVLGLRFEFGVKGRSLPESPSLDRIRPERGYVKGNICVISRLANSIKQDATAKQVAAVALWMREQDL